VNREDLLRRFEQWLDGALSAEDPPAGIDAEVLAALVARDTDVNRGGNPDGGSGTGSGIDRPDDAYALWAAMTALTHEVKLQGRAFKELHHTLGTQSSRTADDIRAAYREREHDVQRDAERRSRREIVGALLDLRDRLARGLDSVRAVESAVMRDAGRPWLVRAFMTRRRDPHAETVAALTKGYALGLERLDQTLDEFNARQIRCEGQPFDPRRMNAIDREESTEVPEGTVLEVYRTGYEWSGEVFRPAQVKVSCVPAAGGQVSDLDV
jgi:molecular chaperone GrpE (heat shock protein)